MKRKLNILGLETWPAWDRKITEIEIKDTIKILSSIKGVSFRKIEETETEGIYHLKFNVKDMGFFYLSYEECSESFAKEAKAMWNRILRYSTYNPKVKYKDIIFSPPVNPLIKSVIFDLSRSLK